MSNGQQLGDPCKNCKGADNNSKWETTATTFSCRCWCHCHRRTGSSYATTANQFILRFVRFPGF